MKATRRLLCLAMLFRGYGEASTVAQDAPTSELPGPPAPTETKEQNNHDCVSLKRGAGTYREIAEETGGLFFDGGFNAAPDDILRIMLDSSDPDVDRIASKRGSGQSGEATIVEVQVDAVSRYVDFILNHSTCDLLQMSIIRPDGAKLRPTDTDVKLGGTNGLRRVRVERPAAGTWKASIEGKGRFQFVANARSAIRFSQIHFERLVLGLMEPTGQDVGRELLVNEEVYFHAWLFGDVDNPEFQLVKPDGVVLERLTIDPESFDKRGGAFTPRTLYDEFQVKVSGTDSTGASFSRVAPGLFSVRSFVVREDPTRWAAPGRPFRFQIQNAGKPERLRLQVETTSKIPLRLSSEIVDVGTASTELVDIELSIARGEIPPGESLSLTAISTSNPDLEASGTMQIGPSEE